MAKIRKWLQPKLNSIFWLMPKFRHNQIKESSQNQSTKFGQNHTSEFGKNRSYGCLKLNTNSVNFLSKESLSCKKPINMNWRHWWAGQKLLILQYFFAFLVRLSKSLKSELFFWQRIRKWLQPNLNFDWSLNSHTIKSQNLARIKAINSAKVTPLNSAKIKEPNSVKYMGFKSTYLQLLFPLMSQEFTNTVSWSKWHWNPSLSGKTKRCLEKSH